MKVYIDPGHGGQDPGVVADDGYTENEFVLDWAELVSLAFTRAGHDVRLSRPGYETKKVSNLIRARDANLWGADVYISLHGNGFHQVQDPDNIGSETLYWNSSTKGRALAERIQEESLARFGGTIYNRGAKPRYEGDRGATVLSETTMPAVIVEPGFLSDRDDRIWLRQFSTQAILAEALVAAVEWVDDNYGLEDPS